MAESGTGFGFTIDYKDLVLAMVDQGQWQYDGSTSTASRTMLELRLTLFVAAASSPNCYECLLPFPPCFFDRTDNSKDIWALQEHIRLIPPLDTLKSDTALLPLTWNLLHWIFTNPLTISPLFDSPSHSSRAETFQAIEAGTKLQFPIWMPYNGFRVFEVTIPNPNPAFVEGKEKHGSYFAFHGSPLCNFHSIIHRGLKAALNKRNSHGDGTYLSSNWLLSNMFATRGSGWDKSVFGNGKHLSCTAICEIVNAPPGEGIITYEQQAPKPNDMGSALVSVVADDNLLQLAYLILNESYFH